MQQVNIALFQWLSAGHAPSSPWLWSAGLIVAAASWLCAGLLGLAAWRQPAQRGYAVAVLCAAGVASLMAHALADAIAMPRPFMAGLSPNYGGHGARGSLPSAHASVMFTVALVLCLRPALRRTGVAVFTLALAMGWARIHMGMHFPLDVAAGLLLALAIAASRSSCWRSPGVS
ncbi:phosphatase PAP2 family protein [Variovorax sp. J22P168]|uniref:phosphatase PAP2 family protein n=1 Tax=Variovorax jilinensis TaxID=3053513 RepID=UPI002577CC93|nr:phosphatase PAP2 family protein [Variovorax sp. J22P168]MDM0013432.1 phosphatase PAP2 family protein [Variovorax sp. J22P168]